jgi:hypothetical protein
MAIGIANIFYKNLRDINGLCMKYIVINAAWMSDGFESSGMNIWNYGFGANRMSDSALSCSESVENPVCLFVCFP